MTDSKINQLSKKLADFELSEEDQDFNDFSFRHFLNRSEISSENCVTGKVILENDNVALGNFRSDNEKEALVLEYDSENNEIKQ